MSKKAVLITCIVIAALILIVRLFFLQIVDQEYKISADNNALRYETIYPARGEIFDRNGKTLVGNRITYDIMVIPIDVTPFDTADFCNIFDVDYQAIQSKLQNYASRRKSIGYQSFTLIKQASKREYNIFAEKAYKFPGFYAVSRTTRVYPFDAGANIFGYINEADSSYLAKHPEARSGDYVGITGLEASYEEVLRGERGYHILLRDVHNRIRSSFRNGEYDKEAVPGANLTATIDGDLQAYCEYLMQNKVGSIVAIEPSTGEILAIVSSPGITTEQLADFRNHYAELSQDPYKPMFNRATMSSYPPGSTFKTVNALIGQQNGVIDEDTRFSCNHGYFFNGGKMGCHGHPTPLNLKQSIMMSCNAYYAQVFRRIIGDPQFDSAEEAFSHWKEQVKKFGFGRPLGSDFPSELSGTLPSVERYDRIYGKGRWGALNILSLAIGQGEIGATPLHIANLASIIANRGYYIIPHLVKDSPDSAWRVKYTERHYVDIDEKFFDPVVEGMYLAVNAPAGTGGTARRAYVEGLEICGKTGTAQNPHGKDHSAFMCFAPRENPQIAVAVYIENAGAGATWAAPIASLIVEKYLKGEISRPWQEQEIATANLLSNVPVRSRGTQKNKE